MKKVLAYTVLGMASLLFGAGVGYFVGSKNLQHGGRIMPQMYALGEYETLTSLQYQQADPAHAKQALTDLLDFMHQVEITQGNEIGASLEIDRGLTYMRLALLEERGGNKEQAKDYVRKAQASFAKRSTEVMSEAELRVAVAKQDSRTRYALPAIFVLRQSRK